MAWIIGQPYHQMWSWLCSVVILIYSHLKCLDSSLSLYSLVYDFLWFFFYLCINFLYLLQALSIFSLFSMLSEIQRFFLKCCPCRNHNNNYPCISGKLHKYVEFCIYKHQLNPLQIGCNKTGLDQCFSKDINKKKTRIDLKQ